MSTDQDSKDSGEPQLFFAIALFVGSLFLFLGVDLLSFSYLNPSRQAEASLKNFQGQNFLRANLTSKHYPIRDYSQKVPQLEADSFLVFDEKDNKFLADYQTGKEFSIASLTKLVNALVVQRNRSFYVQKQFLKIPPLKDFPVKPWLERSAEYRYQDLFRGMLAASNNEAAYSFAHEFPGGKSEFLNTMEQTAKEIGMEKVNFSNPAGFDKNGGNHASAEDVLILVREILKRHPDILEATLEKRVKVQQRDSQESVYLYNTNYFVRDGTEKNLAGQKTGHTSLAGECMVLIEKGEFGKIIYVLLGSQDRVADMKTLIEWTHKAYKFGRRD